MIRTGESVDDWTEANYDLIDGRSDQDKVRAGYDLALSDVFGNRCQNTAKIQCILRTALADELAMHLAEKILLELQGRRAARPTVGPYEKLQKQFSSLLIATEAFFGWYNRTYQQAPSQHPEHEWCVLGEHIDRIRNATSA